MITVATLEDAERAVEAWRESLQHRPSCCAACGYDPDPPRAPTPRQLTVLNAYVAAGGRKQAAAMLGIQVNTLQKHFGLIFQRTGLDGIAQACYLLGARYW